jgi:hypothetical protein
MSADLDILQRDKRADTGFIQHMERHNVESELIYLLTYIDFGNYAAEREFMRHGRN